MDIEMMVRAWKGETVSQDVPASPIGEADWDGSSRVAPVDVNGMIGVPTSDSISVCSCYITCNTNHSLC